MHYEVSFGLEHASRSDPQKKVGRGFPAGLEADHVVDGIGVDKLTVGSPTIGLRSLKLYF